MAHGAGKGAVAERVRYAAVCSSAEACDLSAVWAGAGPAAHAAHSSTGQAELVAVWMAPVAHELLEANQVAPSIPLHTAVFVGHTVDTRAPSLRGSAWSSLLLS